MKNINTFILTILLTISPLVAFAHGDGGHGSSALTQEKAIEFAEYRIGVLIDDGKIDKSWTKATFLAAEERIYGSKTEWAITFNNPQARDSSKRTLYIFLSMKGKFLAANFTGK